MADRFPTVKVSTLPQLCGIAPRPQALTGFLRQWMIQHFSELANIEHEQLDGYLYRPDITKSGILITTNTLFEPEQAAKRPALVIKRNGWKNLRLGIDNRMMGYISGDGHEYYANYWQGSHTFFCLAGTGAESELLAAEVFHELNQFSPTLRPKIGLHRLEVLDVGEVYLLEEAREHFAVPVSIGYAWEEHWRVETMDASPLQSVDMALLQSL